MFQSRLRVRKAGRGGTADLERHASHKTPEHFYDCRWAAELIEHVCSRLREPYEQRGKLESHDALAAVIGSEEQDAEAFLAIAARFAMTKNALRVALSRLHKEFRDVLLKELKVKNEK